MIRIDRGTEPPSLRTIREKKLAAAGKARASGGKLNLNGYDNAREELYKSQNGKCAYCERLAGLDGQPVEHFRPKAEVWRGNPWTGKREPIDKLRYWWLTWSYSNLLFACVTCNCPSRKSNWFPLEPGTKPLQCPKARKLTDSHVAFDVAPEHPLLVDPGSDDPLDHIAWVPLDPAEPVERMEWRPVHKTERGRYTIKILGLDRGVPDHVGDHIRHNVYPRVEGIAASASTAASTWAAVMRDLLGDTRPFLAATHDALDFFVPADLRNRLGLTLTRPDPTGRLDGQVA